MQHTPCALLSICLVRSWAKSPPKASRAAELSWSGLPTAPSGAVLPRKRAGQHRVSTSLLGNGEPRGNCGWPGAEVAKRFRRGCRSWPGASKKGKDCPRAQGWKRRRKTGLTRPCDGAGQGRRTGGVTRCQTTEIRGGRGKVGGALTFFTAGWKRKSPASFRSSQIMGMRGTASMATAPCGPGRSLRRLVAGSTAHGPAPPRRKSLVTRGRSRSRSAFLPRWPPLRMLGAFAWRKSGREAPPKEKGFWERWFSVCEATRSLLLRSLSGPAGSGEGR